jgi:hypothetical protein
MTIKWPEQKRLAMTIKCDQCTTCQAEYKLGERDRFEILAQFQDLPRVLESVQFRRGTLCEDCLLAWLLIESDHLYDRERTRWLYRQEATHRQITNNPFHCSECRLESGEWVYVVPGKGQRTGRRAALLASSRRAVVFKLIS